MRPPRVRLRTMTIAVAVVAVLLPGAARWAETMQARSLLYWNFAGLYSQHQQDLLAHLPVVIALEARTGMDAGESDRLRRDAARYAAWSAAFRRAARYPWLSVTLDPPPPG